MCLLAGQGAVSLGLIGTLLPTLIPARYPTSRQAVDQASTITHARNPRNASPITLLH